MSTSASLTPSEQAMFNSMIPVCEGEADCKVKWEAAQLWLTDLCGYKLQTVTDVILETYPSNDFRLAGRVTKEPLGNGRYRILVFFWCSHTSCTPTVQNAGITFNSRVGAARP
jgi:hypothetical protein